MFRFRCENNGALKLDSPLYARGKADGNWTLRVKVALLRSSRAWVGIADQSQPQENFYFC